MKILICNDDGINSIGIKRLAEKLSLKHEVLVIAPDSNRSACSHSLSIFKEISIKKLDEDRYTAYSISGTPADCVKIAMLKFPFFKPDVVLSGINDKHNLGSDTMYSGTLAIAIESSFFGNVSFAFSAFTLNEKKLDIYCEYVEKIVTHLLPLSNKGDVWNVNFPENDIKGIKITPLGKQIYTDRYEESNGNIMLVGELVDHDENPIDCDVEWVKKGYISITPILFNKTDYKKVKKTKRLCKKLS